MVVVAQAIIRGRISVQDREENATIADAKIISQMYFMQLKMHFVKHESSSAYVKVTHDAA